MKKKKKITRRNFVKGVGGATLALPVLPSLLPSTAFAQTSSSIPTRVVLIQMRDGTFPSEFWPKNNPTQLLDATNGVYGYRLSDINGPISNVLSSQWDPVRNKISVIRGLGFLHYAFHMSATTFCGASGNKEAFGETAHPDVGSSIDCILENSPRFGQGSSSLAPLRIGDGRAASFWRPNGGRSNVQRIPAISGDKSVFDYVFKNFSGGSSPAPAPVTNNEPLILDKVLEQFTALMKNRRLSSVDKQRLQQHADQVQDLQKRVDMNQPAPVATCEKPNLNFGGNYRNRFHNYMDTIANALACNQIQIAKVYIDVYDDNRSVDTGTYHKNSHAEIPNSDPRANCRKWQGWAMDRVAYLMKSLDSIPTPDGKTLLDHSIVVFGSEEGYGLTHSSEDQQLIIGGGANGKLNMGYYIDYRKRPFDNNIGLPWAGALISVMQAAGLTEADYKNQGENGMFGISQYHFPNQYRNPDHYRHNPLPFLYTG